MLQIWGWVKITGSGISHSELRAWPLCISLSGIWQIPNLRASFLSLQPSVSTLPPHPLPYSLRIKGKPLPLTHHLAWAVWSQGITRRRLCAQLSFPSEPSHVLRCVCFFLMECSCFTMLLASTVQWSEPAIYTYPLIFGFPSHLGHHGALRVPCAIYIQKVSFIIYFMHSINTVYISTLVSQFIPPTFPPWCPSVCVSISVLQTWSSVPFF